MGSRSERLTSAALAAAALGSAGGEPGLCPPSFLPPEDTLLGAAVGCDLGIGVAGEEAVGEAAALFADDPKTRPSPRNDFCLEQQDPIIMHKQK